MPVFEEVSEGIKSLTFEIDSKRDYKNQDGKYDSDVFQIVVWNELAVNLLDIVKKGALVGVKGRLTAANVVENGKTKYNVQITGERVSVLEKN